MSTRQLTNYDLYAVVTPVNVKRLHHLLVLSDYDNLEANFLVEGFTHGFKLGYTGPRNLKLNSANLPFWVGNNFDLWDKIMTEVEAKRYAGPYVTPEAVFPDGYFVNPIGLVEKPGKLNKTRMIIHYSYPPGRSVNDFIPDEYSRVVYQDFQDAVHIALDLINRHGEGVDLHFSKTDAVNAFRVLPIAKQDRPLQMLKARNPRDNSWCYFVDLNCGFGSSSSCFLYDKISKMIRHLYRWKTNQDAVVYLDDGLQAGISEFDCNCNLDSYLWICDEIGIPTSEEKTVRATRVIIFLGLLLDAKNRKIGIPDQKVSKASNQLETILGSKKATVKRLQMITGLLNFFCRAIVPGRAFTHRLYSHFAHLNMKSHYHVRVNPELKLDLQVWRQLLVQDQVVLRPFVDFEVPVPSDEFIFTSDAAKSESLGFATCLKWFGLKKVFYAVEQWDKEFLKECDPSIQFLELVALTAGVLLFSKPLANSTINLWCDNQAVIQMVNNSLSSCKHCMKLVRLITLVAVKYNIKYVVKYISSKDNQNSDLLSRLKIDRFLEEIPEGWEAAQVTVPKELYPLTKFFQ